MPLSYLLAVLGGPSISDAKREKWSWPHGSYTGSVRGMAVDMDPESWRKCIHSPRRAKPGQRRERGSDVARESETNKTVSRPLDVVLFN